MYIIRMRYAIIDYALHATQYTVHNILAQLAITVIALRSLLPARHGLDVR